MSPQTVIYDISLPLEPGVLTYPGDEPFRCELQADMAAGATSNVSAMQMSAHGGTHVDAPRHFDREAAGMDAIPTEVLYGPALVLDFRRERVITADMLRRRVPPGTTRLLLKTDNSDMLHRGELTTNGFEPVYLDACGAQFLADRQMRLVGIDYLSVDRLDSDDFVAHKILLGNGAAILEAVDLAEVEAGLYYLACGALRITDGDAAPCRAVLIKNLL